MCSILGWNNITKSEKEYILNKGNIRGRDGFGFITNNKEYRGFGDIMKSIHINNLLKGKQLIGNFRATPTTETESREELLQPYDGIVHNGVIANDKEFGEFEIDSMVLPQIINTDGSIEERLTKIKGSYAMAWVEDGALILACNYKPLYYWISGNKYMFASIPEMLPVKSIKLEPYSYIQIQLSTGKILQHKHLERKQYNKTIVCCSGGLDSTAVAYILKAQGHNITLAHFRYGCLAEEQEIKRVEKIAKHGGFGFELIDMPKVMSGTITEGTYHTDDVEGVEYAYDWVSARNLLMLSILTAFAETNNYGYIAFGGNLEESGAFPDNEQEFSRMFNNLLPYSVQNGLKIELLSPVAHLMKHEIVKQGIEVNTHFELTWSCYGGNQKHCGDCAPCFMRKTAFERNKLKDPVFL